MNPEQEMMGYPQGEQSEMMGEQEPQPQLPLEVDEQDELPEMEIEIEDQLEDIAKQYIEYASEVRNDYSLDIPIKSKVLLDIAQSLSYIIPLVPRLNQDLQGQQVELEMKQQEHQMNMQMKQEEHALSLQMKQGEHEMKLQQQKEQPKPKNDKKE